MGKTEIQRRPGEVATADMPCTSRAIKGRLRRGFVVECQHSMTGFTTWKRIAAVRFNEWPHWNGLWVQEHDGLCGWFSPAAARFRLRREGERP
jgi:hypothetical protein